MSLSRRNPPSRGSIAALVAAALVAVPPLASLLPAARAQEPAKAKGKDDALEDLLKEIKAEKKADPAKPSEEPMPSEPSSGPKAEKPAAGKSEKSDATKGKPAGGGAPAGKGAAPSDVAPKDKGLDSLLEKLGETEDKPSPDDRKRGGGGGAPPDDKGGGGGAPDKPSDPKSKPKPEELTGKSRDLDEHLEELTGRKRKKNPSQEGEDGGPLSQIVKEMRDVEQRLGKTDTGAQTRKKQQQIVKNLEQLIEQAKASSSQSQSRRKQLAMKPGGKPGQQPGQQPGTTGGNAPFTKPQRPTNQRALAGGKDEWGHLPPELRQELENVSREEFLPARQELIRRYYEAVAKKSSTRGE